MTALRREAIGDADNGSSIPSQQPQSVDGFVPILQTQQSAAGRVSDVQTPNTPNSPASDDYGDDLEKGRCADAETNTMPINKDWKHQDPDQLPCDHEGSSKLVSPRETQSPNVAVFFRWRGPKRMVSCRPWSPCGQLGKIGLLIMFSSVSVIVTLISLLAGLSRETPWLSSPNGHWTLDGFQTIVTFGDSYTDEGRSTYLQTHNYEAPPVGWFPAVSSLTYTGGYVWPRYVSWYSGATTYNYAVSGAVCNKNITYKAATAQGIQQYEMSAFAGDDAYQRNGAPFLQIPPNSTVYAIWIGANDLGAGGFLTSNESPGSKLEDYVDCVFEAFDRLYRLGARRFVLMNVIPLDLTPMYASEANGGLNYSRLWPGPKPTNLTAISVAMNNIVSIVNTAFQSKVQVTAQDSQTYPGAQVALFDVWSLFNDMFNSPTKYLNGTPPVYGDRAQVACSGSYGNLTCLAAPSPDSYLWRDELHPSEQADRVVAGEFVNVVSGTSNYATYYSGLVSIPPAVII